MSSHLPSFLHIRIYFTASFLLLSLTLAPSARAEEVIAAARARLPTSAELLFQEASILFSARRFDKMESLARQLIVLAPGVKEFGEDPAIDKLIRKYGYVGTPAVLKAVAENEDLAGNLSAQMLSPNKATEPCARIE